MTEPDAIEAISAAFTTGWPALQPSVPFALENELGSIASIPPTDATSFALLTITMTTSMQLTSGEVGARFVGRNGWIQVKLWTPAGDRSAAARALAKSASDLLEMQNIPGPDPADETIDTQTASTMTVGNDGRWYMLLVRVPFTFFEMK